MSTAASRHANPPTWERLSVILAFPLIGLALGIPWWVGTTSIERRSLGAVQRLRAVDAAAGRVQVRVEGSGREEWSRWVSKCVDEKDRGWELYGNASTDPTIRLVDDSSDAPPYLDNGYLVFPLNFDTVEQLEASKTDACEVVRASTARKVLDELIPPVPRDIPAHAIKYTEDVRLSFVLLNEDGSTGSSFTEWHIIEAVHSYIQPVMDALAPFHKFAIESQILYHAPVKFTPAERRVGETQAWSLSHAQAGLFVNTEQWTLDSGSTNNPVLRFLLFVPKADRRPLVLEQAITAQGEIPPLSSFRIPQFGSVVIPAYPSGDESLSTTHVRAAFQIFAQDLSELLGVPSVPPSLLREPAESAIPNAWQIAALLRTQIRATASDADATLNSISRLVARIHEMRVGKDVVEDVEKAVQLLEEAFSAGYGRLESVWQRTKRASALANRAFFNPNMVGLLYFPDEHKYAVYAPLFAPISVPIVVAILKEVKRWKRNRRARGVTALEGRGQPTDSSGDVGQ
ncbi:hypothetical protein NliqN6_6349 [Naganishia liquefaciens]|uniref:GPI transamidase component PIG-S n=1 Tax=Naganishia liquefaciens TaxID=104408 RepID=A0A8H3TZE4_9TREE|nr:hypothetical protein NliqN6_6349 [Naganishia liquefaciens]